MICHFPEVAESEVRRVIGPEVGELSWKIEKLLREPQLRQKMGSKDQRLVNEKFTWDKVAARMIEMYEEVLK